MHMKTQLSIINLVNAYSTGCGEKTTQSSVGRSILSSIMMAQCVLSVVDGDMIKAWDRPSLKKYSTFQQSLEIYFKQAYNIETCTRSVSSFDATMHLAEV